MTQGTANGGFAPQGMLLLLAATFLWGSGNVAQKAILEVAGPFTVLSLRALLALVILLPLAFAEKRRAPRKAAKAGFWIVIATLSFTLALLLQMFGAAETSATNLGFLINTSAVFAPMAAWLLLKEAPKAIVWISALLVLAGAAALSGGQLTDINRGDALCLLSGLFYGIWIVSLGRALEREGNAAALTLLQYLPCAVAGFGMALMTETIDLRALATVLPEMLYLGIFATGLSFFLAAEAQKRVPSSVCAVGYSLEAVFGAICAAIFLGEAMTMLALAGGLTMLLGLAILQWPMRLARAVG
ncbi:MAG: DMT family transporter [Aestuariivirga sp.]